MSFRSNEEYPSGDELHVLMAELGSVVDSESQCRVTRQPCCVCGVVFEEELEVTKAKILANDIFICLNCDDEAEARDITVVKMSSHSSMVSNRDAYQMSVVVFGAFKDKGSGCMVTLAKCDICEGSFEEELKVAQAKILSGEKVICLGCDDEAEERDITEVRFDDWMVRR